MTYCLNFDVSLCIRIKKIQLEKEGIGIMFFCGILDPAAVQNYTPFPSLIANVLN